MQIVCIDFGKCHYGSIRVRPLHLPIEASLARRVLRIVEIEVREQDGLVLIVQLALMPVLLLTSLLRSRLMSRILPVLTNERFRFGSRRNRGVPRFIEGIRRGEQGSRGRAKEPILRLLDGRSVLPLHLLELSPLPFLALARLLLSGMGILAPRLGGVVSPIVRHVDQ